LFKRYSATCIFLTALRIAIVIFCATWTISAENRAEISDFREIEVMLSAVPVDQLLLQLHSFILLKDDVYPDAR